MTSGRSVAISSASVGQESVAPALVAIESAGAALEEVLAHAAGLERCFEHALAGAITKAAASHGVEPVLTHDVRVIAGRGIRVTALEPEDELGLAPGAERRSEHLRGVVSQRRL